MRFERQCGDSCQASTPRRTACVSPRSHRSGTRQPHRHADRRHGSRELHKRLSAPLGTRGRAFACQARMQPCSAAARDTKSPLSRRRVPASATCKAVPMPSHGHAGIDLQAPFVIHYRLPRAILGPLLRGAKGVAVVTCPSSPGLGPVQPSPERRRPRGPIRSALPAAMPALTAGRSLKRARHDRTAGRHPMPRTVPALL